MKCASFETCNFCSAFDPKFNENLESSSLEVRAPRNDENANVESCTALATCARDANQTAALQDPPSDWTVACAPLRDCPTDGYCNTCSYALNRATNAYESPTPRIEPGYCPYRPTSGANFPPQASCDSMGVCSCCRSSSRESGYSLRCLGSSSKELTVPARDTLPDQPPRNIFRDEPSCDSVGVCSFCARNGLGACPYRPRPIANDHPQPSCDSMGICSVCGGVESEDSNVSFRPDASCDSMGVCSVCGGNSVGGSNATFRPEASCDSMGVCSVCARSDAGGSNATFRPDASCDSMGVCSVCAKNSVDVSSSNESRPTSGANDEQLSSVVNYQPEASCDSMGVCSVCGKNDFQVQNTNENRPPSNASNYRPATRNNFPSQPAFDSMGANELRPQSGASGYRPPSTATSYRPEPNYESMGASELRSPSRTNFRTDPTYDSMGANEFRPQSGASYNGQPSRSSLRQEPGYDSMDANEFGPQSGASGYRPLSTTTNFLPEPRYDSMGASDFRPQSGASYHEPPARSTFRQEPAYDTMDANEYRPESGASEFRSTSRCNFQSEPTYDSMGANEFRPQSGASYHEPPTRSTFRPESGYNSMGANDFRSPSCASGNRPPSSVHFRDEPSCDSMGVCSICGKNDVATTNLSESRPPPSVYDSRPPSKSYMQDQPSCNSIGLCEDCAAGSSGRISRPSDVAPCDSANLCDFCGGNARSDRPQSERSNTLADGRKTNFRFADDVTEPSGKCGDECLQQINFIRSTIPEYNTSNRVESYDTKNQSELVDSTRMTQEARLAELSRNGNIVIRTAYVTIQPYDLAKPVQDLMQGASARNFADTFSSAASLGVDSASQTDHRPSKKQGLKFENSTESESNHSLRPSADFFRPSKQQERKSTRPMRAQSSLLIQNDYIALDDLRRSSKSMTSMARLSKKQPNKWQSAAAKIRHQNMEYEALLAALETTSDRKTADRILREMDTCKANIRCSVKAAMLEQRRNKTEKFDPIPIAIFDNFAPV